MSLKHQEQPLCPCPMCRFLRLTRLRHTAYSFRQSCTCEDCKIVRMLADERMLLIGPTASNYAIACAVFHRHTVVVSNSKAKESQP